MYKNKALACLLAGVLITAAALSPVPAYANSRSETIKVTYNNYSISLNGRPISNGGTSSTRVEPFNYGGTIYLPVRAVSEAMNITVSYDAGTNTVALVSGTSTDGASTTGTSPVTTGATGTPPTGTPPTGTPPSGTPPTGTPPSGTAPTGTPSGITAAGGQMPTNQTTGVKTTKNISVVYKDIKVTLNGTAVTLQDTSGKTVEPFLYNGSVYLPVRAVATLLGITAAYDSSKNAVNLTDGSSSGTTGPGTGSQTSDGTQTSGTAAETTGTGAYTLSTGSASKSDETLTASAADQSAAIVSNGAKLTLSDMKITKSGDTSSMDSSSFYGLNAAVLAKAGSTISISDTTINTTGTGANGVFACGSAASIDLSNVTINCTASGAHGVDATVGGAITMKNVNITTAGNGAAGAIATDRGGGTITAVGGTVTTTGTKSPTIYSTGDITVSDATLKSSGTEAAVIEGKNSITLNNCTVTSEKNNGAFIYQSMSGDAGVGTGTFTMNGGSLTAEAGPLFYSTNTIGVINLKDAELSAASGILLKAGADSWGTSGSNGADITLNADTQTLKGNVVLDSISTAVLSLKNGSSLQGAIDSANTAESAALSLDKSSTWTVTGNSYLTSLTDGDSTLSNISSNGFTVYYDSANSANSWLGGKTVSLTGGGKLVPLK